MYEELDDYIQEYEFDSVNVDNYWDEVAYKEACETLLQFKDDDWKQLFDNLDNKSNVWKQRIVSSVSSTLDDNQLKLLLILSNTEDVKLFFYVIEALRFFDKEKIINYDELCAKIDRLWPELSIYGESILEEFKGKKDHAK